VLTTTNGLALTLECYARWVAAGPVTGAEVPLDTTDAEAYRAHRRRDVEGVLRNMRAVAASYPEHRIRVLLSVITRHNIEHLARLVESAAEVRVPRVEFASVLGCVMEEHGRGQENPFGEGPTPERSAGV